MMNLSDQYSFCSSLFKDFGEVFLAGGYVRDTLLGNKPKDCDVFINTKNNDFKDVHKQTINEIISARFKPYQSNLEFHKSEPFLLSEFIANDIHYQVMWTDKENCQILVNNFDWNVSLFGFDKNGLYALEDINNIKPGKFLKLNKLTFPLSSLRRGYRFSERFSMQIDKNDLKKLLYFSYSQMNKSFGL